MGKPKPVIELTVKEARLAAKGVGELNWSDAGTMLMDRLNAFVDANTKERKHKKVSA